MARNACEAEFRVGQVISLARGLMRLSADLYSGEAHLLFWSCHAAIFLAEFCMIPFDVVSSSQDPVQNGSSRVNAPAKRLARAGAPTVQCNPPPPPFMLAPIRLLAKGANC